MMIKVIPNQSGAGDCAGTRLETESGEVIRGVRRLELIAEPGSKWRAKVEIDVSVGGVIVADLIEAKA